MEVTNLSGYELSEDESDATNTVGDTPRITAPCGPAPKPAHDESNTSKVNTDSSSSTGSPRPAPKPAPLQITVITESIDKGAVVCSCSKQRPSNGQSVVLCRSCNRWHHFNCTITHGFTEDDTLKGYQCQSCKDLVKKVTALNSRKRRNGSISEDETPRRFASGSKVPPVVNDYTTPDTLSSSKTKKSFKLPSKSTPNTCISNSTTPSGLSCDSLASIKGQTTADTEYEAREAQLDVVMKDRIDEWQSTPTTPTNRKIHCTCPDGMSADPTDFIVCYSCTRLQHKACMPPSDEDVGHGHLCDTCREAKAAQHREREAQQLWKAVDEQKRLLTALAEQKHMRMEQLKLACETAFWKHYCILPNSAATTPAVKELTSTFWAAGRIDPIHPAPQAWVRELYTRIQKLCAADGRKLFTEMKMGGVAWSPQDPVRLIRDLRELAVLIIHQGPWKGKRQELGVLAEVLGLEDKGMYWKG